MVEREALLGDGELADQRVVQSEGVAFAGFDAVVAPHRDELRALHRQLADQRGQQFVVGVPARPEPEAGHQTACFAVPVHVELAGV